MKAKAITSVGLVLSSISISWLSLRLGSSIWFAVASSLGLAFSAVVIFRWPRIGYAAGLISSQPNRHLFPLAAEHDEGGRIPPMLIGHRQASFCFGFLNFLVTVLLIMAAMSLSAQTIEIKLVDGRNGHPMVGTSSYVNVWVGEERKEAIAIPTDEKGVARLQLTLSSSEVNIPNSGRNGSIVVDHPVVKYDESFRINAPYVLCGPGGRNYSWLELKNFSTKEVLDHGYVSANTCGKVTMSPHPGEVILFVRPLTFWEKLKQ